MIFNIGVAQFMDNWQIQIVIWYLVARQPVMWWIHLLVSPWLCVLRVRAQ